MAIQPRVVDALKRYALASLSVAVALTLTLSLPLVKERSPYLLLALGVMLSAGQGLGPGVFATVLSTLLAAYLFIPPFHGFSILGLTDLLPLSLFCVVGLSVTWIVHRLHSSNQTLRESEEKYRNLAEEAEVGRRELESIIDNMNDGLVVVDQFGNPIMMNLAARKMHGYAQASEPKAPLAEVAGVFELRDANGIVMPPEQWPGSRALTGEFVRNLEVQVLRRDTDKRFVGYYSAVPVRDPAGQIKLAIITITDITEHKRMEQRLRDAQKLEGIGLLAGGIAHDFNNLLTGVIGNASLAMRFIPPDSEAVQMLERILKTGEQLAHLTRQMLAYSGKGRLFVEPLSLSELFLQITPLVQPSIPKKIELRLHLEPGLPLVQADKGQMQQVFMNLVLNAAEAIGSEPGLIEIKTGIRELVPQRTTDIAPGRYVYLEVRDNGCGMDEATRAKIFDPFFSTKFVGRGLGLAAVDGIVRGHKGVITVETRPGKGSCFRVLFPVADAAVALSEPAAKPEIAGNGTVLLVDDEELVRQTGTIALKQFGYRVLSAGSGPTAIDLFKRWAGEISIVILDLSMPGMGGEEVLPELRKIRPGVKVVVVSGYSEDETMRRFAGQQVSGFLQKPFTPARLAEQVKSAIART